MTWIESRPYDDAGILRVLRSRRTGWRGNCHSRRYGDICLSNHSRSPVDPRDRTAARELAVDALGVPDGQFNRRPVDDAVLALRDELQASGGPFGSSTCANRSCNAAGPTPRTRRPASVAKVVPTAPGLGVPGVRPAVVVAPAPVQRPGPTPTTRSVPFRMAEPGQPCRQRSSRRQMA